MSLPSSSTQPPSPAESSKIVVLASGEGSLFESLVKASRGGHLPAEVVGLIANRPKIGAIGRANRLDVAHRVLARKSYASLTAWDEAVFGQLREWSADWVVLAGFLALIGPRVLRAYPGKVVNIHPGVLPRFGGKGMYGDHVHAAVLREGVRETGVTIHLVDEHYDHGRILAVDRIEVKPDDTVSTLAERVKRREALFYAQTLTELVTGRISSG